MATNVDTQLQSLLDGFDALTLEYQRLWSRCATLETNIHSAREQYARLADLCPSKAEPLDLSAPTALNTAADFESLISSSKIVDAKHRAKITAASRAADQLRPKSNGVAVHAASLADRPSAPTSSAMPSISESPLEQDFTVPGTPSKLGCPFASMANRRLSAHAASVVSRYKSDGPQTPRTTTSRGNGRASSSARASMIDPIKAEVCAMDSPAKPREPDPSVQGSSAGVCPIRFLDQHSPEEVAAYFESHKHELPRSHELCVKRYQTNAEQIRELDAKYGNIVSMIQGLGQKHVPMLPEKLADGDQEELDEDRASHEKIRKWASTVADGPEATGEEEEDEEGEEDRQSHFDRPMKDVRLGESPSRPWGIQVPIEAIRRDSAPLGEALVAAPAESNPEAQIDVQTEKPRGRCPFGFDRQPPPKPSVEEVGPKTSEQDVRSKTSEQDVGLETPQQAPPPVKEAMAVPQPMETKSEARPIFIKTEGEKTQETGPLQPQMVFTGPVFIGYSVEEAMRVLQSQKMT